MTLVQFAAGGGEGARGGVLAGGHVPVLAEAVVEGLAVRPGGVYVDVTLGLGGHSALILERSGPNGQVLGLDRDPEAIAQAQARLASFGSRFVACQARFGELPDVCREHGLGDAAVDGIVADLGISSFQLADAQRGFSFTAAGELDMRMDPTCGQTARELIAACSVNELRTILQRYGQEPLAGRYAAAIKRAADQGALRSAEGLATVIEKAAGPGRIARARKHVATRVFMALRMAVNEEIVELDRLLRAAPRLLKVHGRLAVISFHSGEDRRVKTAFTDLARPDRRIPASVPLANFELPSPRFRQVTRKPVRPSAEEAHANPRSRSAKLRVLEKISSDVANAQE